MNIKTILSPLKEWDVPSSFIPAPKEEFPEDYDQIKKGDPEVVKVVVEIWKEAYNEGKAPQDDYGWVPSEFDSVKTYEIIKAFKEKLTSEN